jgi:hypothetical protein
MNRKPRRDGQGNRIVCSSQAIGSGTRASNSSEIRGVQPGNNHTISPIDTELEVLNY